MHHCGQWSQQRTLLTMGFATAMAEETPHVVRGNKNQKMTKKKRSANNDEMPPSLLPLCFGGAWGTAHLALPGQPKTKPSAPPRGPRPPTMRRAPGDIAPQRPGARPGKKENEKRKAEWKKGAKRRASFPRRPPRLLFSSLGGGLGATATKRSTQHSCIFFVSMTAAGKGETYCRVFVKGETETSEQQQKKKNLRTRKRLQ